MKLAEEDQGEVAWRREVLVRNIVRRLRKLIPKLREIEAEIEHWEAFLPGPTLGEVREIVHTKHELTRALHLRAVLYSIRSYLNESCVLAEEPAQFAKAPGESFTVHPGVIRALWNIATANCRRGLRSVVLRKRGGA
jgi:hypothetical protein